MGAKLCTVKLPVDEEKKRNTKKKTRTKTKITGRQMKKVQTTNGSPASSTKSKSDISGQINTVSTEGKRNPDVSKNKNKSAPGSITAQSGNWTNQSAERVNKNGGMSDDLNESKININTSTCNHSFKSFKTKNSVQNEMSTSKEKCVDTNITGAKSEITGERSMACDQRSNDKTDLNINGSELENYTSMACDERLRDNSDDKTLKLLHPENSVQNERKTLQDEFFDTDNDESRPEIIVDNAITRDDNTRQITKAIREDDRTMEDVSTKSKILKQSDDDLYKPYNFAKGTPIEPLEEVILHRDTQEQNELHTPNQSNICNNNNIVADNTDIVTQNINSNAANSANNSEISNVDTTNRNEIPKNSNDEEKDPIHSFDTNRTSNCLNKDEPNCMVSKKSHGKSTESHSDNNDSNKTAEQKGYDSSKYAQPIGYNKEKKKQDGSIKKSTKKKRSKYDPPSNALDLGDIQVLYIGCDIGRNVHTKIRNTTDERENKVAMIGCTIGGSDKTKIYNKPLKDEGGTVIDANIMKMLSDARDSVGVVMGASQGSCWRAGKDLIITAWHVLKPHIWNDIDKYLNELALRKMRIVFGFKDENEKNPELTFEVEPCVLFHCETLDTAILRLKPNGLSDFPPPFTNFATLEKPFDEDIKIYLIGYPNCLPRFNIDVTIWNPTDKRMKDLDRFCQKEGYSYKGYAELDKTERIVVKCKFEHGASGCPGVIITDEKDGKKVRLLMSFIRGFPDFFYSKDFQDRRSKFPNSKLFQQGVNISSLYAALSRNASYTAILQDIFNVPCQSEKENLPNTTAPGHETEPITNNAWPSTENSESQSVTITGSDTGPITSSTWPSAVGSVSKPVSNKASGHDAGPITSSNWPSAVSTGSQPVSNSSSDKKQNISSGETSTTTCSNTENNINTKDTTGTLEDNKKISQPTEDESDQQAIILEGSNILPVNTTQPCFPTPAEEIRFTGTSRQISQMAISGRNREIPHCENLVRNEDIYKDLT